MDNKQNYNIIFSTGANALMKDILQKYGLVETDGEMLENILAGKESINGLVADFIEKIVRQEITQQEASAVLREKLGLGPDEAEKLAKDLYERVVVLAEVKPVEQDVLVPEQAEAATTEGTAETAPEEQTTSELTPEAKITERPRRFGPDTYREPIE
ncbi:MAG: hypothetical protein M1127_01325 [Patescibacteria group bacterium]|nr:hypothetical protein [Patescibacteria group bacterium]